MGVTMQISEAGSSNHSFLTRAATLFGLLLTFGIGAAGATPTQWSGNNHWYEVVVAPSGINWDDAQALAVSRGGYLATPTTNAEDSFVFSLADAAPSAWLVVGGQFGEVSGPWLGGFQPPGSPEPSGNWTWNNGEGLFTTPGYNTNWISGSPNNSGGNEDRIQFYGLNLQRSQLWNDNNNAALLKGYVVEWNTLLIPEPSVWILMVTGLSAMGLKIRLRYPSARPCCVALTTAAALRPNPSTRTSLCVKWLLCISP